MKFAARARRLHKQCGRLGLIVIDYLQLMGSAGSTENRATEISEISRSLKALAKELQRSSYCFISIKSKCGAKTRQASGYVRFKRIRRD